MFLFHLQGLTTSRIGSNTRPVKPQNIPKTKTRQGLIFRWLREWAREGKVNKYLAPIRSDPILLRIECFVKRSCLVASAVCVKDFEEPWRVEARAVAIDQLELTILHPSFYYIQFILVASRSRTKLWPFFSVSL